MSAYLNDKTFVSRGGAIRSATAEDFPEDDKLEQRRMELFNFLKEYRNNLTRKDASLFLNPNSPAPQSVVSWFNAPATRRAFLEFFAKDFAVNGEEGDWSNGFMGSRWSDPKINGHRIRLAYYSRKGDPRIFGKRFPSHIHHALMVMWDYFEEATDFAPKMPTFVCVLCKRRSQGWGNNPQPLAQKGNCCDRCNFESVLPARIAERQFAELKAKGAIHERFETEGVLEKVFEMTAKEGLAKGNNTFSVEYADAETGGKKVKTTPIVVPDLKPPRLNEDELIDLFADEPLNAKGLTKEQKKKEADRQKAIETRKANAEVKAEEKRKAEFLKEVSKKEAQKKQKK